MISINTVLFILLMHYLADFALQTHEQATSKSKDIMQLSYHVGIYSLIWLFGAKVLMGTWLLAINFAAITCICHWLTDYYTSRIGKYYWEKGDLHNGFCVVGFDQLLHYVQLLFTYKFLISL